MRLFFIKHPSEEDLALFAGGELGLLSRWRIEKHLTECNQCHTIVLDFFHLQSEVNELSVLPSVDWATLANRIMLGLADAQSVSRHEPRWFFTRPLIVRTGLAMVTLLFVFIISQEFPTNEGLGLRRSTNLSESSNESVATFETGSLANDQSTHSPRIETFAGFPSSDEKNQLFPTTSPESKDLVSLQQEQTQTKPIVDEVWNKTLSSTSPLTARIREAQSGGRLALTFGPDAEVSLAGEGWMVRTIDSDTNTITITNVYVP